MPDNNPKDEQDPKGDQTEGAQAQDEPTQPEAPGRSGVIIHGDEGEGEG